MTKPAHQTATFSTTLFLPFWQSESHVDTHSNPQYLRLFRAFQQAIISGALRPGAKLPATRPLSQQLKLSRNTVKTAYEMLQAEGYLETRTGSGSYVCSQLPIAGPDNLTKPETETQNRRKASTTGQTLSTLAQRLQNLPDNNPPVGGTLLRTAFPCLQSFPWQPWQRHVTAASRSLRHGVKQTLSGNTLLCEQIAHYLQVVRGLNCQPEQVMICAGAQQGLYLSLRMLMNAGETVLVEDPGYQGIQGAIAAAGAKPIYVPCDEQGFNLHAGLARCTDARMAIITPSRNYPMGYTMSLERRMALIHWATEQQTWLLEDDYDSDFRFDGPPLTALQGMGGENCVIYTGTFTRVLHPAIRLGYLVLPHHLVDIFQQARRYMDGGLPAVSQQALATFMASGQFSSHVRRMRKLYQQRRNYLDQQLTLRLNKALVRIPSDGGMHSVYLLPQDVDDQQLCQQAAIQGLGIRPLSRFYNAHSGKNGLVIGFAGYDEAQTNQALDQLVPLINSATDPQMY